MYSINMSVVLDTARDIINGTITYKTQHSVQYLIQIHNEILRIFFNQSYHNMWTTENKHSIA